MIHQALPAPLEPEQYAYRQPVYYIDPGGGYRQGEVIGHDDGYIQIVDWMRRDIVWRAASQVCPVQKRGAGNGAER